jgi:hypothetical protein
MIATQVLAANTETRAQGIISPIDHGSTVPNSPSNDMTSGAKNPFRKDELLYFRQLEEL